MAEHGGTFRVARESPNKYEITIESGEIIPYHTLVYTDGKQHYHSGADRDGHHMKCYPDVPESEVIRLAGLYRSMNPKLEFEGKFPWQMRGDVKAALHHGQIPAWLIFIFA